MQLREYLLAVITALTLLVNYVDAESSFDLNESEPFFTFSYTTDSENPKNWIGIYNTNGGGPEKEKFVEESLAWGYASETSGSVYIPAGNLPVGEYKVFFLASDGYKWLANPKVVSLPRLASSFSTVDDSSLFTFNYSTNRVNDKNWIGLYPAHGGPINQKFVGESLSWVYAPGSSGTVRISAESLQFGDYSAFYLQSDGYQWLAEPLNVTIPIETGTFTQTKNESLLTFDYSTNGSSTTNWIGIYPENKGPVNEVFVEESIAWSYAPGQTGSVAITIGDLPGGNYSAFFLARDGYKWLSDPISITMSGVRFPVPTATLRNARRGSPYQAYVGGIVLGDRNNVRFSKVSGDSWVSVATNGSLSGTPTSSSNDATVTIKASGNDGSDSIVVRIPVQSSEDCLVQDLRIMTYNMWYGGTRMKFYHAKQLRAILSENIDIVAIQEGTGDDHRPLELSKALGWFYSESSTGKFGIISRYPIAATYPSVSTSIAVRISLDGSRQEINVWNAHLSSNDYGPYTACIEQKSVAEILQGEKDGLRESQITTIVNGMSSQIAAGRRIPVLLMGDFNAPSHLDWIPALKNKHCGYAAVQWPTSEIPTSAGLTDSFRFANPDPAIVPGNTWSPITAVYEEDAGIPEPQDRIDFMYHAGNILVIDSQTYQLGTPAPQPNIGGNEWTSDHRAVITSYRLNSGVC